MDNIIKFTNENSYRPLTGIVTLPSDHSCGERLPLIVFLHGAGESGNSTEETVEKVYAHGIPKYFSKDPDHKNLRVITASPQCIDGLIWDQVTLFVKDWIDAVAEKFNADKNMISITGISMGGYGTWNMITTYPDYFSCAAPICGGGVSWRINESLNGFPIRVYHSLDDDSVPYENSVIMAKQAGLCGAEVYFKTYSDEGHGCWSSAYEKTDLIEWLASNKRK